MGGTERVAATLSNAWIERGDEVIIMPTYSGGGKCFYKLNERVRLIYLSEITKKFCFLSGFLRLITLRKFIISENPDVIISFLPNVNVATILASAFLSKLVIIGERSDPFIRPTPLFWRIACNITYPFASNLTVQTYAVAEKYKQSSKYIKNISIIPNPLPKEFLDSEFKPKSNSSDNIILAIGRYSQEKQFGVLIKAFSKLVNEFPDWSLHIVGEGPERENLKNIILKLDLQNNVKLPGYTQDVLGEMQKIDIFCLTSLYEGFPNTLLEAMGAGKPSITFDCPSGPREMTNDGKAAILVEYNNFEEIVTGLATLMKNKEVRNKYAEQGYHFTHENYSLTSILGKWDDLFANLNVRK